MWFNRKAQAVTEFAVLGSLIIVAFAFLISYSEKLNRQQAYLQQTFRAALKEARHANSSASYTKVAFRRMPNVGSPMELGQLQSFSNSANVLWADGKIPAYAGTLSANGSKVNLVLSDGTPFMTLTRIGSSGIYIDINNDIWGINSDGTYSPQETHGVVKYKLNEDTAKEIPYRATPLEGEEKESKNIFTNVMDAATVLSKTEKEGKIKTTKILRADDQLKAVVTIGGKQKSFTHRLGAGGKYYPGSKTLIRVREME